MPRAHWLLKSEPSVYSYSQLVADGRTRWDGVRNFEARNNLRAMKLGDLGLYYHSNEGKDVVGVCVVVREAFPDPTAKEGDWSAVEVAPVVALAKPVALDVLRTDAALRGMQLHTRNRLSVTVVTKAEFERVLKLGATKLPKAAKAD